MNGACVCLRTLFHALVRQLCALGSNAIASETNQVETAPSVQSVHSFCTIGYFVQSYTTNETTESIYRKRCEGGGLCHRVWRGGPKELDPRLVGDQRLSSFRARLRRQPRCVSTELLVVHHHVLILTSMDPKCMRRACPWGAHGPGGVRRRVTGARVARTGCEVGWRGWRLLWLWWFCWPQMRPWLLL